MTKNESVGEPFTFRGGHNTYDSSDDGEDEADYAYGGVPLFSYTYF